MTVQAGPIDKRYAANGVTLAYTIPFLLIAESDLDVYLNGVLITTGFTITGVENPTSTITFSAAPTGDLYLVLDVPFERLVDYQENGDFLSSTVNRDFDRIWQALKQLFRGATRALTLGSTDVDGSGFYRAKNNGIVNLSTAAKVPTSAANFKDVTDYVGEVLATGQGPIANASNVVYIAPDASVRTVQDMSNKTDPAKGASLLGYKLRTIFQRLSDRGSASDYGVVTDGVTLNDATLATALADTKGGQLMLEDANYVVVSAFPPNPRGIRYEGTGAIVKAVTGGLKQLNTYTSKFGIGVHKEAMYKAYARLAANGQLKMLFAGDSTIHGGNGESAPFELSALVGQIMANKGFSNVVVQNIGVAGTSVSDLNAIPSIDATGANSTDILFIKYGINDPKNRATYYATYRSKLAAIRAATNGGVNALSIVIVGPTSTYDIPNGRDAKWYEQLREIHVSLAEEFQCLYYDPYALLQDSSSASTYWMDNPFGDNRGVHMLDVGQTWVWGNILDFIFGRGETSQFAKNNFQNNGSASGLVSVAVLPANFNYGISIYRCTDGPVNGQLMTVKHADGGTYQTLFGFGASPKQIYRSSNGAAWTGWSGTITAATLLNGWVTFGAPRATPGFYRDGNRGYACGSIKSGTVTAGTNLFVIPAELRPLADHVCLNRGAGGGVGIGVNAAGNVFLQSAGDATETCLDGLSWPIG